MGAGGWVVAPRSRSAAQPAVGVAQRGDAVADAQRVAGEDDVHPPAQRVAARDAAIEVDAAVEFRPLQISEAEDRHAAGVER